MNKIEQARALVRGYDIPDELAAYGADDGGNFADGISRFSYWDGHNTRFATELTADILADSLHYFIALKTVPINEERAPAGGCKHRGRPHVPPDFEWPEGQYFEAQLDLAEVAPLDLAGALPDSGMLYLFFNNATDCTVAHCPADDLALATYPDAATLPGARHYLDEFAGRPRGVKLEPHYLFYVGSDAWDYRDIKALVPEDLQSALSELLGCSLSRSDHWHRLFGRPLYWQGEDERFGSGGDRGKPPLMLYQTELGEGNVHFWVGPDRDFSAAWLDYSGT